jgi:hypothetical protein
MLGDFALILVELRDAIFSGSPDKEDLVQRGSVFRHGDQELKKQ